ncbi:MAG: phospho-N-acetylmuramoyl-pentapeptide-transferase [Firmicutes bacterium]|nr:phospho-N-acetylmuramoyl-pentapeptide-transferase [Bacillota bacterium]
MIRFFISILIAFTIGMLLTPIVIKFARKLKLRQTILHYVDNHQAKAGTPTMGGIGFILALIITSVIMFRGQASLLWMSLAVTFGYGVIGFLDDFIKVYFKRNKGLGFWQKLISQVAVAGIIAWFAVVNFDIASGVLLPFGFNELYMGLIGIPFAIFIFLAMSNSVNLTDGLDGLAGGVTVVYLLIFAVLISLAAGVVYMGQAWDQEMRNLMVYCGALIGGLLAFLVFNGYKARIFMGDTGSLALGGGLASLAILSRLSIFVPIVGIMYVLTSISVIIQVAYFKVTKGKRIFLMAPLHHHLERKGVGESKIVLVYMVITFLCGIVAILVSGAI